MAKLKNEKEPEQKVSTGWEQAVFDDVIKDPEIIEFISLSDKHLGEIGYTEHGFRHCKRVSDWAGTILEELGYSAEESTMARVAGYLHDIGNFVCRTDHGQTGASLLYPILKSHGFNPGQLGLVLSAVGNHEEQYGQVFNNICAAVVLADKSDVHRSRVRDYDLSKGDIHDDVNYAVTESKLKVDPQLREIRLELTIDDTIASVMDYFEIFLERMVMCRSAANYLGCDFHITCNGTSIS
jgi:metal-dependent HD superfamily phosphatase/phosphodiesterase